MTVPSKNYTPPEPGCYIDSHWGQYGSARLITIAVDMGWSPRNDCLQGANLATKKLDECSHPGVDHGLTPEDEELIDWVSEVAEEWLNAKYPLSGHYWFWDDGDFGLWPDSRD